MDRIVLKGKISEVIEILKLEYKSQKDINQKLLSMDIKHNRELKDYKSRCEKAIEYINNHPINACHYLLNILQMEVNNEIKED